MIFTLDAFTLDISSNNGITVAGNLSDEIMKILAIIQNSDTSVLLSQNNQIVSSSSISTPTAILKTSDPVTPTTTSSSVLTAAPLSKLSENSHQKITSKEKNKNKK